MISGLKEDGIIEHAGRAGAPDDCVVRKAAMHDIGPILECCRAPRWRSQKTSAISRLS